MLVAMKKNPFQAWALACSIGAAAASAVYLPGAASLLSFVPFALSLSAAVLCLAAILRGRGTTQVPVNPERESGTPETDNIDLARLAEGNGKTGRNGRRPEWSCLVESLNEDMALLQRSSVKFDLFSSDILFSAQNLSSLASRDLELLTSLRRHVMEFFDEQARTNEELGLLRERMTGSSELASKLAGEAAESRKELSDLVNLSRESARDALAGRDEVEATGGAAAELGKGLARLEGSARREAEETDRISESLARIADIVERTHILATNASIQAARAGSKGSGFAIIAAEVRNLAEASRKALEDIDKVLRSVTAGIRESSSLSAQVFAHSENLGRSLTRTRSSFDAIAARAREVELRLERFDGMFSGQMEGSTRSSDSAREAAARLDGFTADFRGRSEAYRAILEATRESEVSIHDVVRSARVLAQLAGYLKNGGLDRNRVLRRYRTDGDIRQRRLGRRERREELLYNLDILGGDGELLGHLGDLSHSGLLLVSSLKFEPGTRLSLRLELPITAEGERSVPLSVTVRRVEDDCGHFRHGCSIDTPEASAGQIDEVLQSLSLGGVAAPGRDASAQAAEEDAVAVEEL